MSDFGQANIDTFPAAFVTIAKMVSTPNNLVGVNSFVRNNNEDTVETFGFNSKFGFRQSLFLQFGPTGGGVELIAPGSKIASAFVQLIPTSVGAAPGTDTIDVSMLAADGNWDESAASGGNLRIAPQNLSAVEIFNTGGGSIAGPTRSMADTTSTNQWPVDLGQGGINVDSPKSYFQNILTTAAGTLGRIDMRIRRSAGLAGETAQIALFSTTLGTPLANIAISDPTPIGAVSTANEGQVVSFLFSGVNQIALTNSTLYSANIIANYAPGVNTIQPITITSTPVTANDLFWAAGGMGNFGTAPYPTRGNLPLLYENSDPNGPAHIAPFGSIKRVAPFAMPATGVYNSFVDVTELVQEWVSDPGYVQGSRMAFGLNCTLDTTREWTVDGTDALLNVSYRPPVKTVF